MKKVVCLVLALAMIFTFFACDQVGEPSKAPASEAPATSQALASEAPVEKVLIGYSPSSMRDYYVACKQGIDEEAAVQGAEVLTYDPNGNAATQTQQLNDMVTAGAKGLLIVAVASNGMRNTFDELRKAGAYVIAIDARIPEVDWDVLDAHVVSDVTDLGVLSAKDVLQRYPQGANIIIVHKTVSEGCTLTVNGFWDTIKGSPNAAKYKEVFVVDADGTTDTAYTGVVDALQAYGKEVNLFYCINDPSALAVIRAVEEAGMKLGPNIDAGEIAVYGKDASPEGKKMIKEGKQIQSSAQSPIGVGKLGVKRVFQLLNGESFEKVAFLPAQSVTIENVDEFGVDTWQ